MKFGFLSGIGEITPSIFSKLSRKDKARIFINLYNSCVSSEYKISNSYAFLNLNLERIFLTRVDDLCKFKHQSFRKTISFCPASNVIIHAFKSGNLDKISVPAVHPKHPAARLLLLIKAQNGICFDADIMFSQFVYDKISQKHFDKNVYFHDGIIFVEQNGKRIFGVLPSFKEISKRRFHLANCEISKAFNALNNDRLDRMFVVFPRNKDFLRHIEVEFEREEAYLYAGRLKLVPYTISPKIF